MKMFFNIIYFLKKHYCTFKVFFFLFFYGFSINTFSQILIGTVKDSLNKPLQNVNIIAESIDDTDLKFAITDYLGRYTLSLNAKKNYTINVSSIGYNTKKYKIFVNFKKKEHHFILVQKKELLDEIVINYKPKPIMVKKDTLIYLVDHFKNGKEFKMIEILEKLPGFEVTSNGIVKVQGKQISKILVENKSFFGGSTKLAIENIPADALEKIEVIDNFNDINLLKEVSDSEKMILNVKLKKNKTKFIFGDIKSGININKKFYSLRTALFSYSKKINLSYIGNVNNIGENALSIDDLMRFGSVKSSFTRKHRQKNSLYNLSKENKDALKNKSQFSAFNLNLDINNKLSIESYGVFSNFFTTTLHEKNITYLQNDFFSNEKKSFENNDNNLLAIGNFKIKYTPKTDSSIIYNGQFQFISPKGDNTLQSTLNDQIRNFKYKNESENKLINQFFEWHKRSNNKHITTIVFNQNYENKKTQKKWISNVPFLDEYIAYQPNSIYNIKQIKNIESNNIETVIKHYWILHNLHHIYINIGNDLNTINIKNLDQQILNNENSINIFNNDFKNQITYFLNNFYVGLEYKFKIKKWKNKLSLYANNYNLISKQKNDYKIKTTLIEPKWNSEYEFNPTETMKLEYEISNKFPTANQLLEQYQVVDYNTIFKGNSLLKNERFHNIVLNYSKYNVYKGLIIYADAVFNKKTRSTRNQIKLLEIESFITPEMNNFPENNIKISLMIEKQVSKFKISFRPSFRWSKYSQKINDINTINQLNSQNITLKVRTADKKLPKLGVLYKKTFNKFYDENNYSLNFDKIQFNSTVNFLKHFTFNANYEIISNKNQNQNLDNYKIANLILNYKKKGKPLSFELSVQNFLDNDVKIKNSFSNYTISNDKTYILPRIIMFSIRYKI